MSPRRAASDPSSRVWSVQVAPANGSWDLISLLALLAWGASLGLAAIVRRPDITRSASFLFGDQGLNLYVTDRILAGGRLYADVAYPYGPIPAYGYAAFARMAGNSILSYDLFLLAISLINLGLAYLLLRRYTGRMASLLIAAIGLTPLLLVPGSLVGGYAVSPYVPMERTALLAVSLLWRRPEHRGAARNVGIGVALGLLQGVRFGGAFFAGAAILMLDLLALRLSGSGMDGTSAWFRSLLTTLAAFLSIQAAWVGYALLTLPLQVARDFLWPTYVLRTYSAWMHPGERWPHWFGWRMFIGQQLPLVVGVVMGLAAIVCLLRVGRRGSGPGNESRMRLLPLLLPFIFYILAAGVYFRQAYHFYQFAWALVIPVGWPARSHPRRLAAIVALLLPCFALNARANLLTVADPDSEPVTLPDGARVTLGSALRADLGALSGAMGDEAFRHSMFFASGAGLYHFYDIDVRLRQPWFLPGFVRPYDERQLLEILSPRARLVVMSDFAEEPGARRFCAVLGRWNPFTPETCAALERRLGEPVRIGEKFVVFPVRS